MKVLCIRYNSFAGTETLSLRLRANRDANFAWGPSLNLGEGVELGGRVCYPMKVLCSRYNLFAGTDTRSLSVNEPIAKQIAPNVEDFQVVPHPTP